MASDLHDDLEPSPDGSATENKSPGFSWEFANDEARSQLPPQTPPVPVGKVAPAQGDGNALSANRAGVAMTSVPTALSKNVYRGSVRDSYVRKQLDRALERWWTLGEVTPLRLLRDGLLMLEAGGIASEGQRTHLLRAALAHGRGIQTALRFQVDNERVAMVLAEALVEWEPPFDPKALPEVIGDDEQRRLLLSAELERSRVLLTGEGRRRAEEALAMLPPPIQDGQGAHASASSSTPMVATLPRRKVWRQIILVLLLVTLVAFVLWQQRQRTPVGMVAMPAAEYAMSGASKENAIGSARLDAFFVDRFEVTNALYRSCVDSGKCAWPSNPDSATRSYYFTNPAFDDYPVVNVTQVMASAFCASQQKRLPSAEEWQAAAGVSPMTGKAFHYPWGESFDPQRTNSANSAIGDTVAVGSFRLGGDSPSGVSDMGGNVAEWTSSLVDTSLQGSSALVKGGSFASDAEALAVGAYDTYEITESTPEVGFRCVRTHLLRE